MKITWSDSAEEDFANNIEFLYQEWNEKVVQDFTFETERVIHIIQLAPRTFRMHKESRVHVAPITKHITLFYDVKKNEIQLLRFWNNFQNPRKLSLK